MLSKFSWTSRARPVVEIGTGDSRVAGNAAVWNLSRWNEPAAVWGGVEPNWHDITCDVFSASCTLGRQRSTDRFIPGTATVLVDNRTGWADPGAVEDPFTLSMRPGRAIRFGVLHTDLGMHWLFRGFIDAISPRYDPVEIDTVQIQCVDALGEVGRAKWGTYTVPAEYTYERINRILTRAQWPASKTRVDAAATVLIPADLSGQAADLLGRAADSDGGSVFGDTDGNVVFRLRDWQTYPPDTPVDGTIGNGGMGGTTPGTPEIPAHLDPSVGTVSTPYTAGTGVAVTADPADAAGYYRVVGANVEVGRNPAGVLYPGPIRSFALTQTPAAAAGTDVLLEPFNNLTAWTLVPTTSIVAGRTGTAAQITGSAGSATYTIPAVSESDTVTIGFAWRYTEVSSTVVRSLLRLLTDSGTLEMSRLTYRPSDGLLAWQAPNQSVIVPMTQGVWYYIEVRVRLHDTLGSVIVRVNGVEVINVNGVDTRPGGVKTTFDTVRLGSFVSGLICQWDDLYITTGAGAAFKGDITIPPAVASVPSTDTGFTFAAADYPGTGTGYTDPDGDVWTLSAPGAIVPTVPEVPPGGSSGPSSDVVYGADDVVYGADDVVFGAGASADVCPVEWVRPFERADIATRVIVGRNTDTAITVDDADAQILYGIEPFERTDLWTADNAKIQNQAERILETRAASTAPRIRSVILDARTSDNALDLMTTVSPYRPSRYRCRLRLLRGEVFDAEHLATGVAHELTPEAWTLNLNLDLAAPYASPGGRWNGAYWNQTTWGEVREVSEYA